MNTTLSPTQEHDACGTGYVIVPKESDPTGRKSLDYAIDLLLQNDHRIGRTPGALKEVIVVEDGVKKLRQIKEPDIGDGAGIVTEIPFAIIKKGIIAQKITQKKFEAGQQPIEEAELRSIEAELAKKLKVGQYGVARLYRPADADQRSQMDVIVNAKLKKFGFTEIGKRRVEGNLNILSGAERADHSIVRNDHAHIIDIAFERPADLQGSEHDHEFRRKMYACQMEIERDLQDNGLSSVAHVGAISDRITVYKGVFTAEQAGKFFKDFEDKDFKTKFAFYHGRYATNAGTRLSNVHPFVKGSVALGHNGEIVTIKGNTARLERLIKKITEKKFTIPKDITDSHTLAYAYSFLRHTLGKEAPEAMKRLISAGYQDDSRMEPAIKSLLSGFGVGTAPYAGPAYIGYIDALAENITLNSIMDFGGLRPCNIMTLANGTVISGSENALPEEVLAQNANARTFDDKSPTDIISMRSLKPLEQVQFDVQTGAMKSNDELLNEMVERNKNYTEKLKGRLVNYESDPQTAETFPPLSVEGSNGLSRAQRQFAFGHDKQVIDLFANKMADTGKQSVGAMGGVMPAWYLTDVPTNLFHAAKSSFSIVTAPPHDAKREGYLMDMSTVLGNVDDKDTKGEDDSKLIRLSSVILDAGGMENLERQIKSQEITSHRLDCTFAIQKKHPEKGFPGFKSRLQELCQEAEDQVKAGAAVLILDDGDISNNRGDKGSKRQAIDGMLIAALIHKHLDEKGLRDKVSLVFDAHCVRHEHDAFMLLTNGIDAVHPAMYYANVAQAHAAGKFKKELPKEASKIIEQLPNADQWKPVVVNPPLGSVLQQAHKAMEGGVVNAMSRCGIPSISAVRDAQMFTFEGVRIDEKEEPELWKAFGGHAPVYSPLGIFGLEKIYENSVILHAAAAGLSAGDKDPPSLFQYFAHKFEPTAPEKKIGGVIVHDLAGTKNFAKLMADFRVSFTAKDRISSQDLQTMVEASQYVEPTVTLGDLSQALLKAGNPGENEAVVKAVDEAAKAVEAVNVAATAEAQAAKAAAAAVQAKEAAAKAEEAVVQATELASKTDDAKVVAAVGKAEAAAAKANIEVPKAETAAEKAQTEAAQAVEAMVAAKAVVAQAVEVATEAAKMVDDATQAVKAVEAAAKAVEVATAVAATEKMLINEFGSKAAKEDDSYIQMMQKLTLGDVTAYAGWKNARENGDIKVILPADLLNPDVDEGSLSDIERSNLARLKKEEKRNPKDFERARKKWTNRGEGIPSKAILPKLTTHDVDAYPLSVADRVAFRMTEEFEHTNPRGVMDMLFLKDDHLEKEAHDTVKASDIAKRLYIASMSVGALTPLANRFLSNVANSVGMAKETGEGGMPPIDQNLGERKNDDAQDTVVQIGSGRFGVDIDFIISPDRWVDKEFKPGRVTIKMAQGAKPGEGGQLPGEKVTEFIAGLRNAFPGNDLPSPAPHHDIYSIEDLYQLVRDCKRTSVKGVEREIGVKIASSGPDAFAVGLGIAKMGVDSITYAAGDGGTGAGPLTSIQHTGRGMEDAILLARKLDEAGFVNGPKRNYEGGIKTPLDFVRAVAAGYDNVGFGSAAAIAEGCAMLRVCNVSGACAPGVANNEGAFDGDPKATQEYFLAFMHGVKDILAHMTVDGKPVNSLDQIRGRTDLLEMLVPEAIEARGKSDDLNTLIDSAKPSLLDPYYKRLPDPKEQNNYVLEDTLVDRVIDEVIGRRAPVLDPALNSNGTQNFGKNGIQKRDEGENPLFEINRKGLNPIEYDEETKTTRVAVTTPIKSMEFMGPRLAAFVAAVNGYAKTNPRLSIAEVIERLNVRGGESGLPPLSSWIDRVDKDAPKLEVNLKLEGHGSQSFGAFTGTGINYDVTGALQYGAFKMTSGGNHIIRSPIGIVTGEGDEKKFSYGMAAGNSFGYGARGGFFAIEGNLGPRAGVRNAGASYVIDGDVGDNSFTFMSRGSVVVLGDPGYNFGSGSSAGIMAVYHKGDAKKLVDRCHKGSVSVNKANDEYQAKIHAMLQKHCEMVRLSKKDKDHPPSKAQYILDNWEKENEKDNFYVVTPIFLENALKPLDEPDVAVDAKNELREKIQFAYTQPDGTIKLSLLEQALWKEKDISFLQQAQASSTALAIPR